MSLQTRFALTSCLIVVPILAILSIFVSLIAEEQIQDGVDENLRSKAAAVKAALWTGGRTPLTVEAVRPNLPNLDRQAALGTSFRLFDLEGRVLYPQSGVLEDRLTRPSGSDQLLTMVVDGARTRVLLQQYVFLGQPLGYVEVRDALSPADATVSDIRRALFVGGSLAAVGIIVASYFLAGRIVAPIKRVSDLSISIQKEADFSRRLPDGKSPREARELKDSFNSLLDRIEAMIAAQRTFFAESSHELRRPLTTLRTNIDVLKLPGLTDTQKARLQADMEFEAAGMSKLISGLLLLARGELGFAPSVEVDFSAIAAESTERFQGCCRDHDLVVMIEPSVIVMGSPDRLQQVVENLLDNAHQYTFGPGTITLSLRSEGKDAVLEVADTGIGMSEAELEHAFERLYRGEEARRARSDGTGLGLAIVKHVAEAYFGTVGLESTPGNGTKCTVRLPCVPASQSAPERLQHRSA